ncbi:MAG: hypothetical protein IKJ79_03100 [Bacteroidaceae bacterium]|nr:hypothetical protein [Bacteroidaceae bacterium]
MKKITLLLLATLTLGLYSCEKDPVVDPTDEEQPAITLEKYAEDINSLTFKVATTHVTKACYMILGNEETVPGLETIFAEGTEIELDDKGVATVVAENLQAETSYQIVAVAKNITKMAGSNTLYMTTKSLDDLIVSAEIVQVDHEKMNFRVNSTNAEKISYVVMLASKETPSVSYVLLNGESVEVGSKESVEVTGLECSTDYKLLVAAEGAGQTTMIEPIDFKTEDDPTLVIKHEYTRARGTKYSSSYFMMFSYEDPAEEDNFAYNDMTLSLDFYGDPAKDYLPAGTYEVKESTDPDCISSYRYSTYGYDNGVQLKSGHAIVSIDPETKAYSFEIDLYLKDGRHLQATYNGDVDNMPVIDVTTITTTFSTASASTTDDGQNWILNLADVDGNKAQFNICNAFKSPYLVNNAYTINTSEEADADEIVPSQFDAATSFFTVAGESEASKFLTGTLHVDIDWDMQKYMLAFYGTLEGNYVVEAKYEGAIDGISLAQSDEIIEVILNSASATMYGDNTNWYMTFAQTVDGVENYKLVLDVYSPASEYLPAGYYRLNNSEDGRYLGVDGTSLRVAGENQYSATDANASVSIDMAAKTYSFDISFKIEDGRIFKLSYTGEVNGMPITDPQDVPDDIQWTTFSARKWYSDNWALTIKSADEQYTMVFDMRTGDSEANYIVSGEYTIGTSGQYIDGYYSEFNGNKNAYKEALLNITYNETEQTYDIDFNVTLNDDRNFTGTYSGVVAGSPAE